MKSLFSVIIIALSLIGARTLTPVGHITTPGNVITAALRGNHLYVASDAGTALIYDWPQRKLLETVRFQDIHDFMGNEFSPRVFGIDINGDGTKLLLLTQAEAGKCILWLYRRKTLTKIIAENADIAIQKAAFIDDEHILMATLGSDLILYDLENKKIIYRRKFSPYKFSDFALSDDKTRVACACESGNVYIIATKSGKTVRKLTGGNNDNVFKVDFKNSHVLACGLDRKAALYDAVSGSSRVYKTKFLVYAGALNRDASLAAAGYDEKDDIAVIDTANNKMRYLLKGQRSTINTIIFAADHTLISASDDNRILIWSLP